MNLKNFETQIGLSNWHFNELYYVLLDALIKKNKNKTTIPNKYQASVVNFLDDWKSEII